MTYRGLRVDEYYHDRRDNYWKHTIVAGGSGTREIDTTRFQPDGTLADVTCRTTIMDWTRSDDTGGPLVLWHKDYPTASTDDALEEAHEYIVALVMRGEMPSEALQHARVSEVHDGA